MKRQSTVIALLMLAALLTCVQAMAEDTLILPASLKIIEAEAFLGSPAKQVILPEGLEEIHSRAFTEAAVEAIHLPQSLRSIADDAFDRKPAEVSAVPGSYAYDWAVGMGWLQAAPIPVTYRALVIGNVYDNTSALSTLWGCDGDRITMTHMLQSMSATPYTVTTMRNLTSDQIISAIDTAFSGANSNDVSLLYYSGHGFTGTGALVGTDRQGVSFAALRNVLDRVPGRKIIILDSCYSGQAISRATEAEEITAADLDAVNRKVISAFAADSTAVARSGELASNSYYVLTAASKDQLSWGNQYYGFFTYCLEYSSGWNAKNDSREDFLAGDKDADGCISLEEAYTSTEFYLDALGFRSDQVQQRTQIYPTGSSFKLWGR